MWKHFGVFLKGLLQLGGQGQEGSKFLSIPRSNLHVPLDTYPAINDTKLKVFIVNFYTV